MMILADKIIRMRKKNGWSQEELAEKMNVSRQAVSKWEGAQSVPELEKILLLGEIFGVTTDYLLKDEIENEEFTNDDVSSGIKRVTMQEALDYIEHRKSASLLIAFGVFLCIMSPAALVILCATPFYYNVPMGFAVLMGIVILLILVASAIGIFSYCGFKSAPFSYLSKDFETEYGVSGKVKELDAQFTPFGVATNIIATCLCVICPTPILIAAFFGNGFWVCVSVAATLAIIGIAVMLYIVGTVRSRSMHRLLKICEFTEEGRKKDEAGSNISKIYWLAATAIYLAWSFLGGGWDTTWILWPIAGVLFPIVYIIANKLAEIKK
ncbi:MAG: helix-turn-helix transcriptional regulator [Clostridia bacterium]|nr:helix-turn-helix transcriptional regulator [Clostridia bacterium]